MLVKITPNDKGSPVGKLADAELHFTEGPLAGLKLLGFAVWERRNGSGRNVTFPSRQYSVNGERRSYALLRPMTEVKGAGSHPRSRAERLREVRGRGHGRPGVRRGGRSRAAALVTRRYDRIGSSFAFSCCRFGGSVHSARWPLANSLRKNASFMPPSMMSHGSILSFERSR